MSDPIDGLESTELLDAIVAELAQEFPEFDLSEIADLVAERRDKMPRPATGGSLFLEAQKLLQLRQDELAISR